MFDTSKTFSGFAVKDVNEAARFYGETLGLDVAEQNGILTLQLSDEQAILVYPKPNHTPASFTTLNFPVSDIEAAVDELIARGVRFEDYEEFSQDERLINRAEGGPPIAWFSDPSGNILSVLEVD